MPTEFPGYTMVISIDGMPLNDQVAGLLAGGFVDNNLHVPDMFVLNFADADDTVIDLARLKIGSAVKLVVQATGDLAPVTLLNGEITALETDIDSAGKHLIVRGLDKAHRLQRGTRIAAYLNVKPGDVATQIAGLVGLGAGKITSRGTVRNHIIQPGVSDWDFLQSLAAELGVEVSVVDGVLNFSDPVKSSTASGNSDSTQSPFVIESGRNLVSLRATVGASDQVKGVDVRGWDPKTKAIVLAKAEANTDSVTIAGVTPAMMAQKFGNRRLIESNSAVSTQAQAQDRAKAIADHVGGVFAELDGVANGNPAMKAGKAVQLVKVGKMFDGKYTLTSTRHDFTAEGGYRTIFTVSNASDRSFYGVTKGAGGGARSPMMSGALTAIVTDLKDPDSMGRVKVKIPVLADDLETWWARVVCPGAGGTRGTVWLPEVGDEVLVVFGMGNVDEPYVIGGLFNGKDKPDKAWSEHVDGSGQVTRRAFATRTGMVIELLEGASSEKIVISTKGNSQQISIEQNGEKSIKIVASGPIQVTTQKDATVEAASGSISVKGMSVSVEATNALELKGATVKISAQGTAELSASGPTSIKGAVVNIN